MTYSQEKTDYIPASKLLLFSFLGFLVCLLSLAGHAQAPSEALDRLFTIQNISVDITARSAASARKQAIEEAEAIAYRKLLQKITQPEGRSHLPELSHSEIQSLISGIEVRREKVSSQRYIANLDVRFEPSVFSDFLADHNVGHVLSAGNAVLVMHAHTDGLVNQLWDMGESVRSARGSVDWLNRIRKYVFASGTIRERKSITYSEVDKLHASAMQEVSNTYSVKASLFITSKWQKNEYGGGTLTYSYKAEESATYDTAEIYASGDNAEKTAIVTMYETILSQIDSVWRQQLLVDTDEGGDLLVTVPVHDLATFVGVENKLRSISIVSNIEIARIGIPFSEIEFSYTGRRDQLVMALKFAGLALEEKGGRSLLWKREPNNR